MHQNQTFFLPMTTTIALNDFLHLRSTFTKARNGQ